MSRAPAADGCATRRWDQLVRILVAIPGESRSLLPARRSTGPVAAPLDAHATR